MTRPIRVGNFSGYAGDRFSALAEVLAGDEVDVLVGDFLAEISLAPLSAQFHRHPDRGSIEYFRHQLKPHLSSIAERGIKVVTNAGGFNPAALAAAIQADIRDVGLSMSVAHIRGDDVLNRIPALQQQGHAIEHFESRQPLSSWSYEPKVANAYLGGHGIREALLRGADIVVCGRVTDASLVSGPAAWWHGWHDDDWNELAGAVTAGHIIECGAQAQGGNFSGFAAHLDVAGAALPGYPIAVIEQDGSCTITKHGTHSGHVTTDTVTAQLLYEIQGPTYLNPDVTVHLEGVKVDRIADDAVRVTGAAGSPPPPTTKVAVFATCGWQTAQYVLLTAPSVQLKQELLHQQLLHGAKPAVTVSLTRLGMPDPDAQDQWGATCAVRILASASTRGDLDEYGLAARVGSLYLSSFPGYYNDLAMPLKEGRRELVEYWPGLLDQAQVSHEVVLDDGAVHRIPAPTSTRAPEVALETLAVANPPDGPTRRVPLHSLLHARSGDKGGNSSLGLWVKDERSWPWLSTSVTADTMRELIPEAADLTIERYEFPELRAVLFILKGLLGNGGSSNDRPDQVGKAVGEYVLSRTLAAPTSLVTTIEDTP